MKSSTSEPGLSPRKNPIADFSKNFLDQEQRRF